MQARLGVYLTQARPCPVIHALRRRTSSGIQGRLLFPLIEGWCHWRIRRGIIRKCRQRLRAPFRPLRRRPTLTRICCWLWLGVRVASTRWRSMDARLPGALCSSQREHGFRRSRNLARDTRLRPTLEGSARTPRVGFSSRTSRTVRQFCNYAATPCCPRLWPQTPFGRTREAMKERLGREVTLTDLYLLHVLGPTGAFRFLEAVAQRPRVSSQSVASLRTLRNAGLLARDGRPLTVADTYAAVRAMLAEQRRHSDQLLSTALPEHRAAPGPIEVSETH